MLPDFPTPLNEHVLEEIFSIVYDTSYSTVQSLLLTNRLFHALARPLLYRYIGLNLATDSFKEEIQLWLINPEKSAIPRAIRHICIYTTYYSQGGDLEQCPNNRSMRVIGEVPRKANTGDIRMDRLRNLRDMRASRKRDKASEWSAIAALISQTTQLRSLAFSCYEAMPLVLLQSIHNYPTTIHLNIASWTRFSPDTLHTDPAELALVGSPSLRSLQATIYNPERNAKDLRLPAFWRLVRSAPNLRSLMLNISHGGCVVTWDSPQQIQEWTIRASEFERTTLSHGDIPSGIRNLRITGDNLFLLKDRELSRLTTLDCSHGLPLEIVHSLTSLTHLTLRNNYNSQAIDDRLIACSPLASLSVVGWRKCLQLDTILTHHGHSLCALSLHEFERTDPANPRGVLFIDELLRIRDGFPHLEELSIDINIPENPLPDSNHLSTYTHQEVYDTLSTFLSLRRLQLNFNLGISSYNNSQNHRSDGPRQLVPLADESFVKKVWETVNLSRTASLAIHELRVAQGEAQRATGFGLPTGWVLWERRTHHWFKGTPSERDDEPDKIIISKNRDTPDFTDDVWRECRW